MITVLNFCQKDRDQALHLLQWMKEIGTCRNHELTLQTNIGATVMGMHHELVALGTAMFDKCNFRTLDLEDERPWPFAANNAWRDYVYFSRVKSAQPFFWLEPDCMFIPGKGCPLCVIQKAYEACGKPFMGGEVTRPEQRMSGVGVYPAYVTAYTKRLPSLNPAPQLKKHAVAWDQYLKDDIVPNCSFTHLIQHVWNVELGKPETIPTFPDQESLKLIKPETILFHRCKDGTLLNRLRERFAAPASAPAKSGDGGFTVCPPSLTPAQHPSELDELKATIARLEVRLAERNAPTPPLKAKGRQMKKRTPAQQSAIDARMAKVRAAKAGKVAA